MDFDKINLVNIIELIKKSSFLTVREAAWQSIQDYSLLSSDDLIFLSHSGLEYEVWSVIKVRDSLTPKQIFHFINRQKNLKVVDEGWIALKNHPKFTCYDLKEMAAYPSFDYRMVTREMSLEAWALLKDRSDLSEKILESIIYYEYADDQIAQEAEVILLSRPDLSEYAVAKLCLDGFVRNGTENRHRAWDLYKNYDNKSYYKILQIANESEDERIKKEAIELLDTDYFKLIAKLLGEDQE
jgi:hypothetical protein